MLDLQQYFVKEHTGMFRTSNAYDILNPESQEKIGVAQEKPSLLRMVMGKNSPTRIEVRDNSDNLIFQILKPFQMLGPAKIRVLDADQQEIGYFKSKIFTLTGGFFVFDQDNQKCAEIKGNWRGRSFKLVTPEGAELGQVTQEWAGLGKEMFTTADNYVVALHDEAAKDTKTKILLLAAALTIDMIFHEN